MTSTSRGTRKYSTVRASAKLLGGMMQKSVLRSTKLFGGEILGIDDRIVDIGEDLELVGDARVIAVGGQAVADRPLAPLAVDERLDHAVLERALANPAVGHDAHQRALRTASASRACGRSPRESEDVASQCRGSCGSAIARRRAIGVRAPSARSSFDVEHADQGEQPARGVEIHLDLAVEALAAAARRRRCGGRAAPCRSSRCPRGCSDRTALK